MIDHKQYIEFLAAPLPIKYLCQIVVEYVALYDDHGW
jgi:hypothetical protein